MPQLLISRIYDYNSRLNYVRKFRTTYSTFSALLSTEDEIVGCARIIPPVVSKMLFENQKAMGGRSGEKGERRLCNFKRMH